MFMFPAIPRSKKCHGNATTTNFEGVLARNVEMSDYLQQLQSVETVNELIDEVYNEVVHVEPWMGRGAAGASSAFVLVRRLAQLEPTDKELTAMLQHKDSPYIRAVGFLWLRYCHDPKEWWGWIDGYLDDKEMFAPGQDGREISMGSYVRDVILASHYYGTLLPRVPTLVARNIRSRLNERGMPTDPVNTAMCGGPPEATGVSRRPASVKEMFSYGAGQRGPVAGVGGAASGGGVALGGHGGYSGSGGARNRERERDYRRDDDRYRRDGRHFDSRDRRDDGDDFGRAGRGAAPAARREHERRAPPPRSRDERGDEHIGGGGGGRFSAWEDEESASFKPKKKKTWSSWDE